MISVRAKVAKRNKTPVNALVAAYLLDYKTMAVGELQDLTGLHYPTIWSALERMVEDEIVIKEREYDDRKLINTYTISEWEEAVPQLEDMVSYFRIVKGYVWYCMRR
jgi:DNA-binding MarR family transcriptional regulator